MSRLRFGNDSRLYIGLTTAIGPLPSLMVAVPDMMRFSGFGGDPWFFAGATILLGLFAAFAVALIYCGVLKLIERFAGGFADWQGIALCFLNPVTLLFLIDWFLRRDRMPLPWIELSLPVIGLLLAWIVLRILQRRRQRRLAGEVAP